MESATKIQSIIDEESPPQNLNQQNHNSCQYSSQQEKFKDESIQNEQIVCIEEETSSENYSENDIDEIQLNNEFFKEHKGMGKNEELNKTTKYKINPNNETTNSSFKNQDVQSNNLCMKDDQIDGENQTSSNKSNDDNILDSQAIKILSNSNNYNKLSDDEFDEFQTNQTKNDQVLFCFGVSANKDQVGLHNVHIIDENSDSSLINEDQENDSPYLSKDNSDSEIQNDFSLINDDQENDTPYLTKDNSDSNFSLNKDDPIQPKVLFDVNYNFDKVTESIQNVINNQNGINEYEINSHNNNDSNEPNAIFISKDKTEKVFEIDFNFSEVNELIQKFNQ